MNKKRKTNSKLATSGTSNDLRKSRSMIRKSKSTIMSAKDISMNAFMAIKSKADAMAEAAANAVINESAEETHLDSGEIRSKPDQSWTTLGKLGSSGPKIITIVLTGNFFSETGGAAAAANQQAENWLATFLSESLAVEDIPWECSKALIILKQGYQVPR